MKLRAYHPHLARTRIRSHSADDVRTRRLVSAPTIREQHNLRVDRSGQSGGKRLLVSGRGVPTVMRIDQQISTEVEVRVIQESQEARAVQVGPEQHRSPAVHADPKNDRKRMRVDLPAGVGRRADTGQGHVGVW